MNITLSIPNEVYEKMKQHSEIRWSEVARKAIVERLDAAEKMKWMDKVLEDSALTPNDIKRLSSKINRAATLYLVDEYNRKHKGKKSS